MSKILYCTYCNTLVAELSSGSKIKKDIIITCKNCVSDFVKTPESNSYNKESFDFMNFFNDITKKK